jgi:four helix bundle protein
MAFKFEKLEIWKRAMELSSGIHELTRQFPRYEQFNLMHQLLKAADSVALNIAEGSTGQSNKEQAKFLNYSIRSAIEVVSCLFLAKGRNYVETEKFQHYYNQYEVLVRMITSFRDGLV